MGPRILVFMFVLIALLATALLILRGLGWLLEYFDPVRPMLEKEAARIRAIESTLHAVRSGLIRLPSVFRCTPG